MPKVWLCDADSDYLEALQARLGGRLAVDRPDLVVGTFVPGGAEHRGGPAPEPPLAQGDFLVYNPDDLPGAADCDAVRAGRFLRLMPGAFVPLRDEAGVARLGGVDRILDALLRRLPGPETAEAQEASGVAPTDRAGRPGSAVHADVRCICLLASFPTSVRQALSLSAAESLASRGFEVDHLDLTPIDPDGHAYPELDLPPLPDALPSISDLLLGEDAFPRQVRPGGPAFLLPPRRADDLAECPPEQVAEVVRRISLRPRAQLRLVLAVCGEVPFSLVREVAGACGRILLLHGPGAGAACRSMRREVSLMLPGLPGDVRFREIVLPLDPLRLTVSGWAESVRLLSAALSDEGRATRGPVE